MADDLNSLLDSINSNPLFGSTSEPSQGGDLNALLDRINANPLVGDRGAVQSQVNDLFDSNLRQGKPWDSVAEELDRRFAVDPGPMRQHYQTQQKFQQARGRAATMNEPWQPRAIDVLPGAGTVKNVLLDREYGKALQRIERGEAGDKDFDFVAQMDRLNQIKSQESTGQSALRALSTVPAMAIEFGAGGRVAQPIVRRLGLARPTTTIAGAVAQGVPRAAIQTAPIPMMYAQKAVQDNVAAGRDPDDLRGLPAAFALGTLNTAVLGSVQKLVAGGPLPRLGRARLGRAALAGPIGAGEAAGANVAASLADDVSRRVVGESLGLDTRYGSVGSILRGEDDALKHLMVETLTFSAFAGLHASPPRPQRRRLGEKPAPLPEPARELVDATLKAVDGLAEQGVPREQAGRVISDRVFSRFRALVEDPRTAPDAFDLARELWKEEKDADLRRLGETMTRAMPRPGPDVRVTAHLPVPEPRGQTLQTATFGPSGQTAVPPRRLGQRPPTAPPEPAKPVDELTPDQFAELAAGLGVKPAKLREQIRNYTPKQHEGLQPLIDAVLGRAAPVEPAKPQETAPAGPPSPEVVARPPEPAPTSERPSTASQGAVSGFETAQGSTYAWEGGRSRRTKAPHAGHLPGDVGLKPRSERTLFIDPQAAREVGMWQTSSAEGKRVIVRGDEVLLTSLNPQTGKRGLDGRFPFTSEPAVGRSPLELWGRSGTLGQEGREGYKGSHPGSPITRLHGPTTPTPPTGADRSAPRPTPPPPAGIPPGTPDPATRLEPVHPVLSKFRKALGQAADLTPGQRAEYSAAIDSAFGALPEAARQRVGNFMSQAHFYKDGKSAGLGLLAEIEKDPSLTREQLSYLREQRKQIENGTLRPGGGVDANGRIHIDGGHEAERLKGRYAVGGRFEAEAIYLHELAHLIDGKNHELSRSQEWRDIWAEEIAHPDQLSEYAADRPSEGLAEFGRLAYTRAISTAAIARDFPQATAFFKERGLWPAERGGSDEAKPGELFEKRVGGEVAHADILLEKMRQKQKGREPIPSKPEYTTERAERPLPAAEQLLTRAGMQAKELRERQARTTAETPPGTTAPNEPAAPREVPDAWKGRVYQARVRTTKRAVEKAVADPSPEKLDRAAASIEHLVEVARSRGVDPLELLDRELPGWSKLPIATVTSHRVKLEAAIQTQTQLLQKESENVTAATRGSTGDPEATTNARGEEIVQQGISTANAQAAAQAAQDPGRFAPSAPPIVGGQTTISTPTGPVPARYEVRELSDIRASHQTTLGGGLRSREKAGEYPTGLQPRDYSAAPGEREKVDRFAREMVPGYFISQHPDATSGPSTITPDGTVINGNGRQMALERSVQVHTFEKYKAELVKQAEQFGIDPKAIAGMKRPVLVRVVDMDPAGPEARQFARAGNISTTQSQSPVRTAASLSNLIDADLITSLRLEGDTTFSEALTEPSKGKAFRKLLASSLPPQEVSRYFTAEGTFTGSGVELARNMLLARVLPIDLIERLGVEKAGVKRTIEGAIPQLIKLRRDYPETDPTPQLVEALDVLSRNPELRSVRDADNLLAQQSLFGGQAVTISPGGRMMLDFLLTDGLKPLVFRRKLGAMVTDLEHATKGLFAEPTTSPVEAAASILGVAERPGAKFGPTGRGAAQQAMQQADLAQRQAEGQTQEQSRQAVLGPDFGRWQRQRPDQIGGVPDAVKADSPEVEARLQKAHGLKPESLLTRLREWAGAAWRSLTRAQPHLPNSAEYATANEGFRQLKNVPTAASDQANRTIAAIVDPLGPNQLALFERKLLIDNMLASIDRGEPLRFGFRDRAQVEQYKAKLDALVAQTPEVQRALATREAIRREVVSEAVNLGILKPEALTNDNYFHQMVSTLLATDRYTGGRSPLRVGRSFQKARVTGDELAEQFDYNSSYLEAEARWMTELQMEVRKERVWADYFKPYDVLPQLKAEAKAQGIEWQKLARQRYPDHELWTPEPGNQFHRALTVPEKVAEQVLQQQGAEVRSEDLKAALVWHGVQRLALLPKPVVKQLQETLKPRPSNPIAQASQDLIALWKAWTLFNPKRLVGYMTRNFTGDVEPIVAAAPGALKHAGRAISELQRYYKGELSMSPELKAARDLGVIGSSLSAAELPEVKDLPVLRRFYTPAGGVRGLGMFPARYLEGAKRFNEFREGVGRYAAFLHYLGKLKAGEPIHYGGAKKSVVDSLVKQKGPEVAAAHLARNLLGDYQNLTEFGTWARTHLVPFYSWIEVNFKRWPRLAENAVRDGLSAKTLAGAGAWTALNTARLGALYAAVWTWNNVVRGDEEADLSPEDRASLHINLGRNEDGSVRVFRRVGSLSDLMDWFGLEDLLFRDAGALRRGQTTPEDVATAAMKAPANKALQSVRPDVKGAFEVTTGRRLYPDAFNPRPAPRGELAASTLGLSEELRALQGKATRPHYLQRAAGVSAVSPDEAALQEVYELRRKFLKGLGRADVGASQRPMIAEMRDAVTADDYGAFVQAKKRFVEERVSAAKRSGKNDAAARAAAEQSFRDSLKRLDPIADELPALQERKFVQGFLTPEQRQKLTRAREHVRRQREKLDRWWKATR